MGFYTNTPNPAYLYICPDCGDPTFFADDDGKQVPGPRPGNEVKHLPDEIAALYLEGRNCVSVGSYTSAVLTCRKLLMHIAVGLGAPESGTFMSYVTFLADKGYVPPNGKGWVDHIREKGNEANHEIKLMGQPDAEELITFLEMLLKFIYEFPKSVPVKETAPTV